MESNNWNVRNGIEPLSFEEVIAAEPERLGTRSNWTDAGWRDASYASYLTRGLYAEQLQRWFEHFPRKQVLIIKSEAFFAQPDDAFRHTLDFLDLSAWRPDGYEVRNPGAYELMQPETRTRLMEYFAPHNQRLYALLGEDFGWEDQYNHPSAYVSSETATSVRHSPHARCLGDVLASPSFPPDCWQDSSQDF